MPRILKLKKSMLVLTTALAGGTMFSDGCINLAASLPVCGTVLTFCTPVDQVNLLFPLLETPDFNADASCTIPLGCGGSDIYQNIPAGLPGGDQTEAPSDEQTGTGAGGGGGV
jgi:hypothetical protein